jgi:hypothetical protein
VIYVEWHSCPFSEDAIMSTPSARSHSDAAATKWWTERLERFGAGNHTVIAFAREVGSGS